MTVPTDIQLHLATSAISSEVAINSSIQNSIYTFKIKLVTIDYKFYLLFYSEIRSQIVT